KCRKSLGQPLIVVTLPSDSMPPPLMRSFVGAEELCLPGVNASEQRMDLCVIHERKNRKVNEARPTLSVAKRNIGHGELFIWIRPEIFLERSYRISHFLRDRGRHCSRGEIPDCSFDGSRLYDSLNLRH